MPRSMLRTTLWIETYFSTATPIQSSIVVPFGSHRKFLGFTGTSLTDTRGFSTTPMAACPGCPGMGCVAGAYSFSIDTTTSPTPVP